MYPIVVLPLLVLPAVLSAQISIPVRIGRIPVNATIGASGVTVGSGGIYARIPYPSAGTGRTSTASRTPTSSGGSTAGRTAGGSRNSGGGRVASRASASRVAANVIDTGDDYLGVKYTWGGTTPSGGFDCSGFTQYVFRKNGIELPRTSRQQVYSGDALPVRVSALIPGDLVFFDASDNDGVIDHMAIYVGDNQILHSSSSGNGVAYDNLSSERGRFFVSRMVAARRVIGSSSSYAYAPQPPSVFGWLAKAFKGKGGGGVTVEFDPPDWAPKAKR